MAMACPMYGVMIVIIGQGNSSSTAEATPMRFVFWAVAALMLTASALGTHLLIRAPVRRAAESGEALVGPAVFQSRSLALLSLAEGASVIGVSPPGGVSARQPFARILTELLGARWEARGERYPQNIRWFQARADSPRRCPAPGLSPRCSG
jgi:hypothetical protein